MRAFDQVRTWLLVGLLASVSTGLRAQEPESKGGPPELRALKYRLIGPAVGGRVCRAAGVPGDPLTYYAATASGGVWKSSDGGIHWKPIFDDQPASSIGSLAIAPSDPNVIYVGTGEANIRGNVAVGNGIYKSSDAGKTWTHVWKQEGQIGTIVVHPTNPDVAYAAVLGHAFGPNPERGVYRTRDGGKTWQNVLKVDADTGASDVALDPSNPRTIFAGMWQARRRPWEMTSGGPGSGLFLSRDGGDTWKRLSGKETPEGTLGKGLPEGIWGKIGVAVAPSDGRRVYALIEAEKGGLYRSDDGGETWTLVNGSHILRQRAWYYSTLTVHPTQPDVVWCPQVPMLRSIDGGKSFQRVAGLHHGDNHDLWIDPKNPKRLIGSNDGGVDLSFDGGTSWYAPPLPIAQFYHVAVDNDVPYHVSGAMQDLGTASGPSNSLCFAGITNGDWYDVGGGEAGHTAHDSSDPAIVYAGEYGGIITRYDHRTRQARNVSIYPYNPSGHGGEDLQYRFQWTAPILVSPHDPKVIFHASNVLFRTRDGGQHWAKISGDLTRNDKSKQRWSGGPITGDNTGVEIYGTIFAIAESPVQAGVLWVGSDDGLVHVSRDGGQHWTAVTANIAGLPEWGTVDAIEPSSYDAGTAYLVVDAHRLDDMRPYLFKTSDFGATWKRLSAGLPQDGYLHAVREDPTCKGLLFVGTERGVSFSSNDGETWQELKLNLPTVPVHDLRIKNNDLVVGTHGRSIWILDQLAPVRALATRPKDEVHLLPPAPAIRWHYHGGFHGPSIGQNPPPGAAIDYFLQSKQTGSMRLEIHDAQGRLVTILKNTEEKKKPTLDPQLQEVENQAAELRKGTAADEDENDPDAADEKPKKTTLTGRAGLNRIVWDLRYKGADKIRGAKVDTGNPEQGPLVPPGEYTLKLTAAGKTVTGTLTVRPDPRSKVPAAELNEQLALVLQIRDDISRLAQAVAQIRSLREQLLRRSNLLKGDSKAAAIATPVRDLVVKLNVLENKLHNPKAEVTYDILAQRGGAKLYSQLTLLYEAAKDGDGAPTQGTREVFAAEHAELQTHLAELDSLVGGELAKLNETAKQLAIPSIIVPGSKSETAKLMP